MAFPRELAYLVPMAARRRRVSPLKEPLFGLLASIRPAGLTIDELTAQLTALVGYPPKSWMVQDQARRLITEGRIRLDYEYVLRPIADGRLQNVGSWRYFAR